MVKRKFKVAYLLFLIIPIIYYFLLDGSDGINNIKRPDYFYFSAKSSKPATIRLYNDKDMIASWEINGQGYKFFDYYGNLDDSIYLMLAVSNLKANDTITFLSFNLLRNNQVFSLNNNSDAIYSASNVKASENNGILSAVVQRAGSPLTLQLKSTKLWDKPDSVAHFKYLVCFIFLVIFILLIVLAPPVRYFIFTCIITVSVMLLASWVKSDSIGRVEMKTVLPVKRAEFYFNQNPQFTPLKRVSTDSAGNLFGADIDLISDRFIRFDVEKTPELRNLKLSAKYGIFTKTWDIGKMPLGKLVINDLIAKDGKFYICGNDPFISLISNYFLDDICWLILLKQSTFLFISLLSFIILIGLHFWIACYFNIRFRLIYLLFFTIPIAYYFLFQNNIKEDLKKHKDYFFYSVKTSKPATITLLTSRDSVNSWKVNSSGFKVIDCVCNLKDSAGLVLKIKNLSVNDTATFLAFNFFRNDTLYSLYDRSEACCVVENAATVIRDGAFSVVAQRSDAPVILKLIKTSSWQKMQKEKRPVNIVILVFILAFVVILVMAPPSRYFVITCILTLLLLFIFSWLGKDIQDQVTMSTSTPQRSVESYYSNTPVFNTDDKFPSKIFKYYFRTQVELGEHQYIRCDVDDSLEQLNNFKISVKTGWLESEWDFTKISLGKMVLNDVSYNNGTFNISGNDPFFALTTTFFVDSIHHLVEIRYNVFLFIALFIFVFLIVIHKRTAHLNSISFFLAAFFLSLIFNGLLFKPFNSDRVRLISEKRDAELFPVFKADSIKNYTKLLNNYLNDQVTGRNKIIPLNNYIYYSIFGQLLNNPNVYFGKDGWMFYIGANGRETYENREPISQYDLYRIKYLFEERRDWLKERGIKLYIFFPRISQFIYEEKLGPRMYRHNKISKLDQLVSFLKINSDLDIIDVEKPILEAKKTTKEELYYKSSTHWNYYGAYFAYAAIINHIYKDFPDIGQPIPFKDITWSYSADIKKDVDLIEMAALIGYLKGYELLPKNPDIYAGDTIEHHFTKGKPDFPALYVVNKKKQHPNMVMFRDSYTRHLYPYLSHHFNRSSYLWTNTFNKDLVEEEKPDMVIWEMSDRFIPYYFIYKNPPFSKVDIRNHGHQERIFNLSNMSNLTFKDFWISKDSVQ